MTTTDDQNPDVETEEVEEVEETESTDDTGLTLEQAKTELAKVRREAAAKRVSNKEMDAKLKEYEEWKKSQMSEAERLKAERDEAVSKLQEAEHEKLQRKVARAAKLPVALADRIRGNTEEEMLADAKTLATEAGRAGNPLMPGNRGNAVGSGAATSQDEWFRKLFTDAK